MKNLIVNADDLGWTEGVNRGIAEAHRRGMVTSTSLLANGAAFRSALELARSRPGLGVGVHLNLSDGKPVAEAERVPSLLNDAGEFYSQPLSLLLRIAKRRAVLKEAEVEWDAQIQRVRDAGIHPTHLDGHKHVHMLPGLFRVALRLAARHGIWAVRVAHEDSHLRKALSSGGTTRPSVAWKQGIEARGLKLLAWNAKKQAARGDILTADYFCGIRQTGELTKRGLARLLEALREGTAELMCHPGYVDEELRHSATRLQGSRETELQILTDKDILNLVASEGIRLIDYGFASREA